jgi:glutamine synthetase
VRERMEPPAAVVGDAYHADEATIGGALPRTLEESLDALEGDAVLSAAMGEALVTTFLAMKRFEVERHRSHVSEWELDEYAHHV